LSNIFNIYTKLQIIKERYF